MKYIFWTAIIFLFAAENCLAQTYKTYYKNGLIQSVKHQGTYAGCGVPIGTDSLFNRQGNLIETSAYIHLKDSNEEGCHAIITYLKKNRYVPGNSKPAIRYYKISYESEPVICSAKDYLTAKERSRSHKR